MIETSKPGMDSLLNQSITEKRKCHDKTQKNFQGEILNRAADNNSSLYISETIKGKMRGLSQAQITCKTIYESEY